MKKSNRSVRFSEPICKNDNVFKKLTFPLPQLIEFYKNNEADFGLSTIISYE
jgi:hypothetical protein